VYRAGPRGLRARLRGEEEPMLPKPKKPERPGREKPRDAWSIAKRVLKYIAIAVVAWILLSVVLFLISASIETSKLPSSVSDALSSGPNMITGTDTILIIGTDQRPKGSKEPGADTSDVGSRSDTLMLWRVGGGTSRRLSIPRDTVVPIPGHGTTKINAAYAYGGPALTIRTVEQFTGIKINHVIIVNLAAFPPFINAIGGIDIKTGRVCSVISGGPANGGFSLFLKPGVHHLNGEQALVYARTRENRCNPNDSDLTRVQHQQEILNAIKSKLVSPSSFFRLPLASWDAPKVLRTDMGGFTLLSLFTASEIGGNAPVDVLKPTGSVVLPDGEDGLTATPGDVSRAVNKLMTGR
jgi:LCP family protein required for cell wall assembly